MKQINVLNGLLEDFEILPTMPSIPLFNGVTDEPVENDKLIDLRFMIGIKSGTIQLTNIPDLDQVYVEQTTTSPIGSIWKNHHTLLKDMVVKVAPRNVLEIGGAHGYLALQSLKALSKTSWTLIDPNPTVDSELINVKKGYFDPSNDLSLDHDLIVASHVFEHIPNLFDVLQNIYNYSKSKIDLIVSIPNLCSWMKDGSPNALNFEHSTLLSEIHFEELVVNTGFSIVQKINFSSNHSIVYHLKKQNLNRTDRRQDLSNQYSFHKQLFYDYVNSFSKSSSEISSQIEKINKSGERKIFMFGAHLFSQFLISSGLNPKIFTGILDNNETKHNRRLYGSSLFTYSPEILSSIDNPIVVIKAGSYTTEISDQIKKICPSVTII